MYGELVPLGGGDPIPLLKLKLTIGRRENNDIVLRFGNVSGTHCQLTLESGYWYVQDLNSSNGVKVNGTKVSRKRVDPNDELTVAKHKYKLTYNPTDLGASGAPPSDEADYAAIMGRSLLDAAGLSKRQLPESKRYDASDESPGQLKRKKGLD
ncbi:FHA domain protein [Anatilimnocola aggregata]|uniref:FHA domain protein n=1 Tax=Anatilimnocola aggregata TaxID=2528021 RepID=A0A517YEJ7_9BACT|nr:FHA domain-containing protein [Anatilimnocola aggregata]QDU28643.1 FHA domain protein [Anatilimnocola aggregata]